ncbi:MAG: tRNA lysidine(34) synthetase TilS [Pseudomonadota bacterium]
MTDQPVELLQQAFAELKPKRVIVAFSGGPDSTALLLQSIECYRGPLRAVHVDHGVQPDSLRWAAHCRDVAEKLDVDFECLAVPSGQLPSQPNEGQLRDARYALLAQALREDDVLLTAHHADDVAETVLLAALRGGSSHELAGIPRLRPLGRGQVCRPWLAVSRETLIALLKRSDFAWLEDPTNKSSSVRRSFLRQRVMPTLAERWPDAAASLAATAQRQGQTAAALDELVDRHLSVHSEPSTSISAEALDPLTLETQVLVLQRWLTTHGVELPPARRLRELLQQRANCADERHPELSLAKHHLRSYRRHIFLVRQQPQPSSTLNTLRWTPASQPALTLPDGSTLTWQGEEPLAELTVSTGLLPRSVKREGDSQHRNLSKIFQQLGIPPWSRAATPLVFQGELLIQIGNAWRSRRLAAFLSERQQELTWKSV